jgi:hypothetical protein
MNPSASFATAGLSFQLSSPIENRDGSIFEQRSDVRSHDSDPASRSFARTSSDGTTICSYSVREILYPVAVSPPEPGEYSVLKVHSRLLSGGECLYLC